MPSPAELLRQSGYIDTMLFYGAETPPHDTVIPFGENEDEFRFGYSAQDGCDLIDIFDRSVTCRDVLVRDGGDEHAGFFIEMCLLKCRAAADLVKKGAPLTRIAHTLFSNQNVAALRLWGKAFEKAHFDEKTGMLVTAITNEDIATCHASVEDIYQVASILSGVPEAKFVLVLSERDDSIVRGSLRSIEQHGVDVSALAQQFGGGGHRLASGFELPGKIVETEFGWQIA
jgi:hypothetical protein